MAGEQVRFALHGLTPCDVVMVVQGPVFRPTLRLPRGNNYKQGEAQCLSVGLLAVRAVGEREAEAVLPTLLPTAWTPFQQLRGKVPAAK